MTYFPRRNIEITYVLGYSAGFSSRNYAEMVGTFAIKELVKRSNLVKKG